MEEFTVRVTTRIREQEKLEIDAIVEQQTDLYNNISHFIRCAVIEKIRRCKYDRP